MIIGNTKFKQIILNQKLKHLIPGDIGMLKREVEIKYLKGTVHNTESNKNH